jgi:signal transduction histidine kinase/CheY-like chemotaxis protein
LCKPVNNDERPIRQKEIQYLPDPSLRLLIVDDEQADADLIAEIVGDTPDVAITHCRTLFDALQHMHRETADCVLLDLGLPDATDLEGLLTLRRAHADVPVIVLTADAASDRTSRALQSGAQDYWIKGTFDRQLLLRSIAHARERHRWEAEVRSQAASMRAINRISELIHAARDLDVIVEAVTEAACQLTGAENATFVSDHRSREPVCSERYLAVPVIARNGEVQGALALVHSQRGVFSEKSIELVTPLATQAAIAMENARLIESLRLEAKMAARNAELEAANRQLQEVDRLKSQFLSIMSHELRTPLNSIIGFTELILSECVGPINEEQRHQLHYAAAAGHHLLTLITDLLEISRIEAGRVPVVREPTDIAALARECFEQLRSQAEAKKLRLELAGFDDLPPCRSDRGKLKQVLLCLLGNAIKFTPSGHVRLSAEQAHGLLHLRVEDSGIGIAPESMDMLFKPFTQLDSSDSRSYQGTGLGLYLCKKYVTLLGGIIDADSKPGRGTVFTVRLPFDEMVVPLTRLA